MERFIVAAVGDSSITLSVFKIQYGEIYRISATT